MLAHIKCTYGTRRGLRRHEAFAIVRDPVAARFAIQRPHASEPTGDVPFV